MYASKQSLDLPSCFWGDSDSGKAYLLSRQRGGTAFFEDRVEVDRGGNYFYVG